MYANRFPSGSEVKNPPAILEAQETQIRSLGWEYFLGGGHGNPVQYSCLENPMDRRAWWATVHRVAKSDMSEETEHTYVFVYVCVYNIYIYICMYVCIYI